MATMTPAAWAVAALAFVAAALAIVGLAMSWEWWAERKRRGAVAAQLNRLANESPFGSGAASNLLRRQREQGGAASAVSRVLPIQRIETLLEQGALGWTLEKYLFLTAGFTFGLGIAALLAGVALIGAVGAAALGAYLPYMHAQRSRARRMDAIQEQLPETIDLLGRSMRAGHALSSGLGMIVTEAQEPIAGEFRRVVEEQRFGLPFEDALLGMSERVPLVDVRIFVTAVLIQREVGGNLTEILDKLSQLIRERFALQRQVLVYTAEGRMSALVLGILPLAVGLLMFVMNRDFMMGMVEHPIGRIALGFAFVMQMIGYLWARRMARIEF